MKRGCSREEGHFLRDTMTRLLDLLQESSNPCSLNNKYKYSDVFFFYFPGRVTKKSSLRLTGYTGRRSYDYMKI